MASETRPSERWGYIELMGDSMLLAIPMGAALGGFLGSVLGVFGQMGIGVMLGLALGPGAAILLTLALRGDQLDRRALGMVALSTLLVLVLAGGLYWMTVATGFDSSNQFSGLMLTLLLAEGIAAVALLLNGVSDLSRRREHRALDAIRLVAGIAVVVAVVVTWTSPDAAEALVVAAPLALAGAVGARLYDAITTMRERRAQTHHRTPGVTA